MRCPQCQKEMTRVGKFFICGNHAQPITLPVTERPAHPLMDLLEQLPTPLALPISEYLGEESPFIALHRLTDAAELITRFFAIVALSDVHHRLGDFPDAFKRELADKLARPTFGAWRDIAASALQTLQKQRQRADLCVCPYVTELPEFWNERYQPLIGRGDIEYHQTDILALRNFLAHQGRLSDEVAASLFEVHRWRFEEVLQQLGFLANYRLIATLTKDEEPLLLRGLPNRDDWSLPRLVGQTVSLRYEPQRVYLNKVGEEQRVCAEPLDLFPLHSYDAVMLWREEEQGFREVDKPAPMLYLRYNDRRQMLEFTALAPQTSFAQRGEDFLEAFLSAFNLSDWRRQMEEAEVRRSEWKRGGYDFRDLIGDLTEGLVGRKEQLEQAKKWLREHQETGGILWIGGKPGVGKSAFMAELAKRFKGDAKLCVIPFFFRSGDARCSPDQFYHAAILRLSEALSLQVQLDPREPRQVQFMKVLEAVREKQSTLTPSSPHPGPLPVGEGRGEGREGDAAPTVLFMLDGLDEVAGQHLDFARLPFSHQHPRLIWICAGRGEPPLNEIFDTEGVELLWEDGELPPLTERDVRELIEQECDRLRYQLFERDEREGEAPAEPNYRNHFIEELVKRSEGLPLYVRLVIEDLKAGRLTFRDEDKLPEGLRDYFERILERLKVGDIPQMLTDLLALLCWAYEPLTEEIFRETLRPLYAYSTDWERVLTDALRYGHVMLRRSETREGAWGWTLYHESFRQHLRQTPTIRTARERAHHLLLDWCSHWQEHKNPYALRHYAEHLQTAQRYDELYALARSDAFLQAQASTLTAEPDAPLRTLQAALEGSMSQDDAAKMGEFSLAHARRLIEITQESPLDALRAGHLKRAWELADLLEIERCVLWHLLLAWELKEADRLGDARATLERLREKELPCLSDWHGEYAANLLMSIYDINEDTFTALRRQLLDNSVLRDIALTQVQSGDFSAVLNTVRMIEEEWQAIEEEWMRDWALRDIAVALAHAGKFAVALKISQSADVLQEIAATRAKAGEFANALNTAQGIEDEEVRARALGNIAAAQAEAGDSEAAKTTIAAALQTALAIDSLYQADVLRDIAIAQAHVGQVADALNTARGIDKEWTRMEALRNIAKVQAKAEDFANALNIAQGLDDEYGRVEALVDIAVSQIQAGESEAAQKTFAITLETIQRIEYEYTQVEALGKIALAYTLVGKGDAARATFDAALNIARRIQYEQEVLYGLGIRANMLLNIAKAQVLARESDAARDTLAVALQSGLKILPFVWTRVDVLRSIVEVQAQAGEFGAALNTAQMIQDDVQKAWALRDIAKAQAREGEIADAMQTARNIKYECARAEVLGEIAAAQALAMEGDAAQTTFATALETTQAIEDEREQSFAFGEIAVAEARAGEFTAAMNTAQKIEDEEKQAETIRRIALTQVGVGNFTAAFQTTQAIDDELYRTRALVEIAVVEAQAGEFNEALNTMHAIEFEEERVKVMQNIAVALAQAGQSEVAQATFSTILKSAREIEDERERAEAFGEIAVAQAQAGDVEAARATFATALETTNATEPEFRGYARKEISEAQAQAGEFDDAMQTARKIEDDWRLLRSLALWKIAKTQAQAGFGEEAVQTTEVILSERNEHLHEVCAALVEASDKENFKRLLIPCAYYPDNVYYMCGLLARLYPEQVGKIAEVVEGAA